jgi:hypothetical protein
MKKISLIALFAMLFVGCEKPTPQPTPEPQPQPDVTYEAITGAWELTEWNGEGIAEGTYLYITFEGETRRFEMWDNLGSMYVQHKAGSFTIKDNNGKFTLSGQYDNGVGDWNHNYTVAFLQGGEQMAWQTDEEHMLLRRIEKIPELN